jgi:hypothetical protein
MRFVFQEQESKWLAEHAVIDQLHLGPLAAVIRVINMKFNQIQFNRPSFSPPQEPPKINKLKNVPP